MASEYYRGNGVYDYLSKCNEKDHFYWTSEKMWLLVYGDEKYEPKVLTVVSEQKLEQKASDEELSALNAAQDITEGTEVPINFVRFDPQKGMEVIQYWEPKMKSRENIPSEELKKRMEAYGLKMNKTKAQKSINDKSSSSYHDWQRRNMGNSVVVADIDLIRHDRGRVQEIIELKRSHVDINEWEPYQADFNNFELISRLARKREVNFYIVYNQRTKHPYCDNVSKLKIFEFDHRLQTYWRLIGYKSIEQFSKG